MVHFKHDMGEYRGKIHDKIKVLEGFQGGNVDKYLIESLQGKIFLVRPIDIISIDPHYSDTT